MNNYPCICCSYKTREEPSCGDYEICPVCFWEDDPVQNSNPNMDGGANEMSLAEAQSNFLEFGAVDREMKKKRSGQSLNFEFEEAEEENKKPEK